MKIISPSFEILDQQDGLEGIYKQIELAGRTCYKSEDKITDDSAKGFVERMVKSGHGAMLEHGTVYLKIPLNGPKRQFREIIVEFYRENKYSKVNVVSSAEGDFAYITTNYRVIAEGDFLKDLEYICDATKYHIKRVTVKFICDRGVSHEFVRHRVFSFAQESTRYCNYSKDKFGNELTFIYPCWLPDGELSVKAEECFTYSLQKAEQSYFHLLKEGWTPQQARAVLPNALKTELVMTGFIEDWKHFFFLRDAISAHPQARELAKPLHDAFIQREFITE